MKPPLWIGYGAALAVGVLILWAQRPDSVPPLRAAGALAKGHHLATGDVLLPGGPYYLRRAIRPGETIAAGDLASLPIVAVPKGMLPVMVALPRQTADALDAGREGWLCPTATGIAKVSITSIMCTERNAPACLAIVAVPAVSAAAIASEARTLSDKPCPEPSRVR